MMHDEQFYERIIKSATHMVHRMGVDMTQSGNLIAFNGFLVAVEMLKFDEWDKEEEHERAGCY